MVSGPVLTPNVRGSANVNLTVITAVTSNRSVLLTK